MAAFDILVVRFLIAWASSKTIICHGLPVSPFSSETSIPYVASNTSPGCMAVMVCCLSVAEFSRKTFNVGANRRNSCSQLGNTEAGQITSEGPLRATCSNMVMA